MVKDHDELFARAPFRLCLRGVRTTEESPCRVSSPRFGDAFAVDICDGTQQAQPLESDATWRRSAPGEHAQERNLRVSVAVRLAARHGSSQVRSRVRLVKQHESRDDVEDSRRLLVGSRVSVSVKCVEQSRRESEWQRVQRLEHGDERASSLRSVAQHRRQSVQCAQSPPNCAPLDYNSQKGWCLYMVSGAPGAG